MLVAYLEALAITKTQIGLFMTLTLAGDVCVSFVLTMFADGVGRKATLALGAVLMTASGVVFATCRNYWLPAHRLRAWSDNTQVSHETIGVADYVRQVGETILACVS